MIKYLQHPELDKTQWDQLIEQSPQRQVYALSWYLDVVSPGWEAVVELDAQGRYKTVLPVPCRSRYGIRFVQQPLYCQQLGVYALKASIDDNVYQQMLREVYHRFRYVISMQFNTANILPESMALPGVGVSQSQTLYLNLATGYETLYQRYTRDRKMNLKRAQRAQLTIAESEDIEPLISFFKAETQERIYGGVDESAYELLRQLYQALRQRGVARLLYTEDESGRKNAGCLFILWGGRIVYIFNASAKYGRKLNGRTLILDHIIREYAGQAYVLDFESPDTDEPDIFHFYQSFGSVPAPIPVVKYNRLPKAVKLFKNARMRLIRRLRGLPE
ncbi:GNAT family N-acetyltransferase [Pontibacter ruber]|uniref:GNAT family N-acetyltransferase n=1 Tax=Pontibacter ruber TaxID=1343895 RepID=A0ABW5CWW5_9BACT|nr:GNAT family N-acetyltransferase [Pontibacter ruber]